MGTQHRFSPLQTNQYGKVEAIIHMRILTNTFLISLDICCIFFQYPFCVLFLRHCFQFLFYRTNLAAPCLIRTVFGSSASFNQMSKISSGQSCPMNTKFFENVVFFLLCTLGGRWGARCIIPRASLVLVCFQFPLWHFKSSTAFQAFHPLPPPSLLYPQRLHNPCTL